MIFMQQLWLTQTNWNLQIEWNSYYKHLPSLNSLRIHRQVICDYAKIVEIMHFQIVVKVLMVLVYISDLWTIKII